MGGGLGIKTPHQVLPTPGRAKEPNPNKLSPRPYFSIGWDGWQEGKFPVWDKPAGSYAKTR